MTPTEINRLVTRLLAHRDSKADRSERDLLADACSALDGYAKLQRAVDGLRGEHDIVDAGDGTGRSGHPFGKAGVITHGL